MKKLICILTSFFLVNYVIAQKSSDVDKLSLSVLMPESSQYLNQSQLSQLETKITHIASLSGLADNSNKGNFVIYPKFSINESNAVEGGMQSIIVVTIELSLFIKQYDNNILFSSVSKQLKGSGNSNESAITNAISKINPSDTEYASFIKKGKSKIISYYEINCGDIMTQADNMVKKHDYEGAMGILMSIPIEVRSCYNNAQEKSVSVYTAYQNQVCSELIQNAKTYSANKQFGEALQALSQIDPSSKCAGEANKLIEKIEDKVTEQQKKEWDALVKIYADQVQLEKHRIDAIKDIAVAYFNRKPAKVRYIELAEE